MTRSLLIGALLSASALGAQTQFLPGIAATADAGEAFGTFSPNGREFIFTIHPGDFSRHRMVITRLENGRWSAPATLPFSGTYNDREPKMSPDGRRLYFSSNRPHTPGDTARRNDLDLWFVDRAADGSWSSPRPLAGVNTDAQEFCPSVAANGTLYFIRSTGAGTRRKYNVWRAAPVDLAAGRFAAAQQLGPEVSEGFETNVYVTPDESLMLVSRDGAPDSFGGDDLYAARGSNGVWQRMRHLPEPINSNEYDYGPTVTPDGRTLVFTSHRTGKGDIYRVSIGEIERDAVERAALDYLEGFYEGDTAKILRAMRPDLHKIGYERDTSGAYTADRMTFDEAMAYTRSVKTRNRPPNPNWPRRVEIYEVLDKTASAKVTAWWGSDYLLLVKDKGMWQIAQVLWQGPLPSP